MRPLPFSHQSAYAIVFWSTYGLWIVIESIGSVRKRAGERSRGRDRGSFISIQFFVGLGIGLDFALSFLLPQAAIPSDRALIFAIGIFLMLSGLTLRLYCMSLLGRFFTYHVAIHPGHTLIENGPYRYIRHPSYTGALLTLLGFALALGNWAGLLVLLVMAAMGYGYRMRVEEAALVDALGERYRQYQQRTKRLIPFLL